ncbi:thiamine pyrophosphate-binding protein [Rhizobium sp. P28RR-XV]|uniref:thiamine pyrophosphate-binding protein n=1 Tax=Rhizobium sp. P28RR-XV TaxID=2726737 RepID=UPI0014571828|nr:thiamine pyrophosphate-binding protein [Rhizobium sp. P28RR-XV]NLR88201.1 thiamine pyrophosphate-binding protein [Rhizobium sp. P28RR-XV]
MSQNLTKKVATYGSDVFAETLRDLDLRYIALNPGASYRGLHDSLVNFTGGNPEILLCVHEEAAVAIAHGWAKVTGKPMAVALHSNVGLLHGSMGIFNAFCDRVPMVVVGATGPLDAAKRRPWIEWIHTSQDQGSVVRDFVKWDDQPGSISAGRDALIQGAAIAGTAPRGPVYINLDATLQEQELSEPLPVADFSRRRAPKSPAPDPDLVRQAFGILSGATNIVVMAGRLSRDDDDWNRRIGLVERLSARLLADFKIGSVFPSTHPAVVSCAGFFLDAPSKEALKSADVIVNLDWIDFGGTLKSVLGDGPLAQRIISASLDTHAHRGWSKDGGAPYPSDITFLNEPDQVVKALAEALGAEPAPAVPAPEAFGAEAPEGQLAPKDIATVLRKALSDRRTSLVRNPLSWTGADWPMDHSLSALGYDGGGGIGSGCGMAVGSALALRDLGTGLLPVAAIGDGDFLMNASALWTGVKHAVPLLMIVLNNRSFYNDEVHQETVAKHRGRPAENKHIGIGMTGPDIDISAIARGFGAWSPGLLQGAAALEAAIREAIDIVDQGGTAVLEVDTAKGYSPAMSNALRSGS